MLILVLYISLDSDTVTAVPLFPQPRLTIVPSVTVGRENGLPD